MLVLANRGLLAVALWRQEQASGAALLWRAKTGANGQAPGRPGAGRWVVAVTAGRRRPPPSRPPRPDRGAGAGLHPGRPGRPGQGRSTGWLSPDDVRAVVPYVQQAGPGRQVVARIYVAATDDAEAVRALAPAAG
jgi:hypothetical protein